MKNKVQIPLIFFLKNDFRLVGRNQVRNPKSSQETLIKSGIFYKQVRLIERNQRRNRVRPRVLALKTRFFDWSKNRFDRLNPEKSENFEILEIFCRKTKSSNSVKTPLNV